MAVAKGESVNELFTDFAKAFDSVRHKWLLLKLNSYGINSKILDWIKSYLSTRKQRVVIGEHKSELVEVSYSNIFYRIGRISQGSVLEPLLFIIYINDLPNEVKSVCKLYADDNKLLYKTQSLGDSTQNENQLKSVINKLIKWSKIWKIGINIKKCHIMHYGKNNQKHIYYMTNWLEIY